MMGSVSKVLRMKCQHLAHLKNSCRINEKLAGGVLQETGHINLGLKVK